MLPWQATGRLLHRACVGGVARYLGCLPPVPTELALVGEVGCGKGPVQRDAGWGERGASGVYPEEC